MKNINFNSNIIIHDLAAWMDGGSVTLKCENLIGQKFEIEFYQNMILDYFPGKIPGRLYLNQNRIEVRSELEKSIIASLETAELEYDKSLPEYPFVVELLKEKIDYVKSNQYLKDYSVTSKTHKE
jgi:hypothetical protein